MDRMEVQENENDLFMHLLLKLPPHKWDGILLVRMKEKYFPTFPKYKIVLLF